MPLRASPAHESSSFRSLTNVADDSDGDGLRSAVRRRVGGAYGATVGRAGDVARGLSEATARDLLDDLEPYLIAETIPRLVEGVTPLLIEREVPQVVDGVTPLLVARVVPQVVEGLTPYLVETTVPAVVDGVTPYLVETTVPAVVAGVTPALVADLLPQLFADLKPYLQEQLVPQLVDGLTPYLVETVAPTIIDGLMPKIHEEVVPDILDDIVDDPRVRNLIREQSQGMFLDGLERLRRVLARLDDVVETIVRRIFWRGRRPRPTEAADMPPPGRRFRNAGAVTRGVALAIDLTMVSFIVGVGGSTLISFLQNFRNPIPESISAAIALVSLMVLPSYFALSWWFIGRTIAETFCGVRVSKLGGRPIGFWAALSKAWLMMLLLPIWIVAMIPSAFNKDRRGWLDRVSRSEVLYVSRVLWDPPTEKQHSFFDRPVKA